MRKADDTGLAPRPPAPGAPVFDEPWQAQVLALAYGLIDRGVFSARQWSEMLGTVLQEAETSGAPDTQETYYQSALKALEQLMRRGDALARDELDERMEEWRQAYLKTPHGKPVELDTAGRR